MVVKKTVPVPDSPIMHLAVGLELGQFILKYSNDTLINSIFLSRH